MKRTKTSTRNSFAAALTAASLLLALIGGGRPASAQSTFVGDYDTSFAAPLGYRVDPEDPVPTIDDYQTYFVGGALLPDGSIIAGGRHVTNEPRGAFYLRKFTPTGAVDAAFGSNGVARHVFYTGVFGQHLEPSNDIPHVLRAQPDGKILIAGQCSITSPGAGIPQFGTDACVMRFNPDGSFDASFGNVLVFTGGGRNGAGEQNPTYSFEVGEGRFITQTGVIQAPGAPPPHGGTNGRFIDMEVQPDGKIVLVGETRNAYYNDSNNPLGFARAAFIMRLNANGTRDFSFGDFGISQMAATPTVAPNCYPETGFQGVRVQADGRILAVGHTNSAVDSNCFHGNRFTVTRWTATGQLETIRTFDNNTAFNFQDERAVSAHLTRDGSKILVSGSYRNVSGTPSGRQKMTMVRLNIGDLSLDTSFGSGGIVQYNVVSNSWVGSTLYVKAIQPDGKIIGIDNAFTNGNIVRFNPDGSPDLSFGNESFDSTAGRGRLQVFVTNYNGVSSSLRPSDILVRPNGRMNLIGHSAAHAGLGILRAAVSQNTSTGAQNPIDDPQTFAFVHYYDFLNREADAAGLAFWTNGITSCGADAQCVEVKRIDTSAAFFLSIEFQETGFLVYRLYQAAFGDIPSKPVPVRRAEFVDDARQIGEGVRVGIGDWEQRLAANKEAFVNQFVTRPRFTAAYPAGMTPAEFVDALNANAGGALSQAERDALVADLTSGAKSRAEVLRAVAEDETLKQAEFNEAFVLMQYFGYLGRNPDDAPDTDFGGFDFWLSKLDEFGGDFRRAEMVRAFISSLEYRGRFGQP